MEPVEARGLIEQLAVSSLEQRGWTVIAAKRDTLDLDLSVAFDGTPGRILFRNGFTVEKGVAQVAEPAPCFVRVDLGEPSGEPERWALWDRYSFPGSREAPRYVALVIHEAIGKGWCSVAGNSVGPKVMWYDATKALDTILARAEALCPGRDERDRREIIFEDQRENRGEQEERGKAVLGAVVFIVISLGLGGILLHEREQIGGADFPWIAIGIVGSIALVLLSVGVGILLSRFLASR